jgi:hypothetical protein
VGVTARLLVLFENATDRVYGEGELRADGEPKALMARVLELGRMVRENIAYLDGGAADPFDLDGSGR